METPTKYITYYLPLFFLSIFFFISFSLSNRIANQLPSYTYVYGGLLLLLFFALRKRDLLLLTPIDCCMIGIYLYEIILMITTMHFSLFSPYIVQINMLILYYFYLRIFLESERLLKGFILLLVFYFAWLLVIALVSFSIFYTQIIPEKGMLYDCRFLYQPLGILLNTWASLLIPILGVLLLCLYYFRRQQFVFIFSILCLGLLTFSIIITFTRGVYLTVIVIGLYLLFILFRSALKRRWKIAITFLLLLVIGVIALVYQPAVLRTLQMNKTISQQRSLSGRLEMGKLTMDIHKSHPFMGVGSGNFSLAANELRYEDDNTSFSTFTGNTFFKLIAEKGVIGLLFWLSILVVFFCLYATEKRKTTPSAVVFIIVLGICFRECSYSTLLNHFGYLLLVFTFLAIYQANYRRHNTKMPFSIPLYGKRFKFFTYAIIGVSSLYFIFSIYATFCYQQNQNYVNQIKISQLKDGFEDTKIYLDKLGGTEPAQIHKGIYYWNLYLYTKKHDHLLQAKMFLEKSIKDNPYDYLLVHNMAVLLYYEGNPNNAKHVLESLIGKFPNNSLYRLSLFKILYNEDEKNKAYLHLKEAIRLSPSLLETSLWHELARTDSSRTDKLLASIMTHFDEKTITDPIVCAKYGKILLVGQDTVKAERILTKAITALPNLSYPWFYLAEIASSKADSTQYRLCMGRFIVLTSDDKYIDAFDRQSLFQPNPYMALVMPYISRFSAWYNSSSYDQIVYQIE